MHNPKKFTDQLLCWLASSRHSCSYDLMAEALLSSLQSASLETRKLHQSATGSLTNPCMP
jgi:hypothetical protein